MLPPEIVPAFPLLVTKLFIPRPRPGLVVRARLVNWLHQNYGRRLILISASAGFGKTSILAQWFAQLQSVAAPVCKVAWLSLDERDNDPTRFLTYLITALQTIHPGLGEKSKVLLQSLKTPLFETALAELVNELSLLPASDLFWCLTTITW